MQLSACGANEYEPAGFGVPGVMTAGRYLVRVEALTSPHGLRGIAYSKPRDDGYAGGAVAFTRGLPVRAAMTSCAMSTVSAISVAVVGLGGESRPAYTA